MKTEIKEVIHPDYGKGKIVGWVQGAFWRVEFESGEVRDFLPSKIDKYVKN